MSTEYGKALEAAYRLLGYRDRSEKEITDALTRKEFSREAIAEVLAALKRQGFVDDEKFALRYGEAMMRRRGVGPYYVSQKLTNKGVDKETADRTVGELFADRERMLDDINRWVERKLARMKKEDNPLKRKKKVFDFLLRKGFPQEAVFMALDGWDF